MSSAVQRSLVALALGGSSLLLWTGCGHRVDAPSASPAQIPAVEASNDSTSAVNPTQAHSHIGGAHGGLIIPIGSDSYHAEAVIEKSGTFRLFTLGQDEARVQEVDAQTITAYVKAFGELDATPVELVATPQADDTSGKTSQFVGQLPPTAIGKALEVTIPNLRIANERFRIGFTTAAVAHDTSMPGAITGDAEKELYLTPGGKYTQADVEANDRQTASQKFKGFQSVHDMKPKAGDRICPVTFTKANPQVAWVIDGKTYEFCCPPCVDEFVRMAKETPELLKDPEEYIQE